MRILYLVSNPQLNPQLNTGYGRHIRETVHGLESRGHEVKVVLAGNFREQDLSTQKTNSVSRKSKLKSLAPRIIWETTKDFVQLRSDVFYTKRVDEALRSFKPEMVYERVGYLSRPIRLKRIYNIPWLLEVNAPIVGERIELSGKSILSFYARKYEHDLYINASHIFCVSGALANSIAKAHNLDQRKITINHNGVDPVDFETEAVQRKEESFTVGFVGSILPYHGLDKLIRAFSIFHDIVSNSRLQIVGDGELITQLKKQAASLNISNKVKFIGSVPFRDVKHQISMMDVCVLPSTNWYCSPVKLFEYAVLNKPIIAERIAPVEELMIHGIDGLLIRDEKELANSLHEIYSNPESANKMAEHFRNKILEQYTWKDNVNRIENVMLALR